ncbi:MAG: glycosyltransferase family 4 protein [Slackia sp.]|nr:glycosyltransferase family 4 protein [Slackia sp.]
MRILNVSAQKPDSTGSGVYLAETVRCQLDAGHDAAVIAGVAADDARTLDARAAFFPVRFQTEELPFFVAGMSDRMPYPSTRYRDMTPAMVRAFEAAFARAVDAAVEAFRPDAVLCHHLYLAAAVVRERVAGIPVWALSHSTDLRQMRSHGLQRERIVAAMRRLDGVCALHEEQKREIAQLYGIDPELIRVVGTGFNASVFGPEGRTTPPEGPRADLELVYAGKVAFSKGLMPLMAALDRAGASIEARRPDACAARPALRLRIAGGVGDREEYDAIAAAARACRYPVEFLGRLAHDELAAVYRSADAFVLPSFYEGLPLSVVEAIACGCKAVVTDLPGVRPWLSSRMPAAPVSYVQPPRMRAVDEPCEDDLPAFERALSDAIAGLPDAPDAAVDASALSWEHVSERIVGLLSSRPTR